MSLAKFISPNDSCFVTATNYYQVDEDSFIPIVNIGGSIRGRYRKRPKEMYIRATHEVLSGFLKTEAGRQKLLKWLEIAVLSAFRKEE